MKIETFFMLTAAFVINIFAVVIFANFSETADAESIGLASAGQLISDTFGRTVGGGMGGCTGVCMSGQVASSSLTPFGAWCVGWGLSCGVVITRRLVWCGSNQTSTASLKFVSP